MSARYRRRPETVSEIRAENVDFWARAAERYERIAREARMPGLQIWAQNEAKYARNIEAKRKQERA